MGIIVGCMSKFCCDEISSQASEVNKSKEQYEKGTEKETEKETEKGTEMGTEMGTLKVKKLTKGEEKMEEKKKLQGELECSKEDEEKLIYNIVNN